MATIGVAPDHTARRGHGVDGGAESTQREETLMDVPLFRPLRAALNRSRVGRRTAIVASAALSLTTYAAARSRVVAAGRPSATGAAQAASAAQVKGDQRLTYAFDDTEFDGQFLRVLDTIYFGGADIGESFTTARRIPNGDEEAWYREWYRTGERMLGLARESRAAGHTLSARQAYLRAVNYFRAPMTFFYRSPLDGRFVEAWRQQRDAFRQAGALATTPFEIIAIPYERTTLAGYFLKPDAGATPRKTLIITGGYDGTAEETYFGGAVAALERGYNCLLFDGPGQASALIEQGLFFRPDWEAVVTPVVDYALRRADVDPARIALMGRSWGGYLAPRAATGEHRLAALVADAAQYSPARGRVNLLPPAYRDQVDTGDPAVLNAALEAYATTLNRAFSYGLGRGMLTHGVATPLDYIRALKEYTLEGLAGRITCPTLICEAEDDVRAGTGRDLYDALTVARKEYIRFAAADGAGAHDEAGAAALFSQRVFDFLDDVLA